MDGDVASALRKRYTTEPSVLALAGGLVSARWLFLVGCCLAAHCLAPGPAPTTAAAAPDAASALFVLAVASALADLRLFPAFYRPPPRALLLLYDLLVSVAATRNPSLLVKQIAGFIGISASSVLKICKEITEKGHLQTPEKKGKGKKPEIKVYNDFVDSAVRSKVYYLHQKGKSAERNTNACEIVAGCEL